MLWSVETDTEFQEPKPYTNDGWIKPNAYLTGNLAEGLIFSNRFVKRPSDKNIHS